MELSFSNIAWDAPENDMILELLAQHHVQAIEVAPSKVWPNWEGITPKGVEEFVSHVSSFGLRISSFQAIVYGMKELSVFGNAEIRDRFLEHIRFVADLAQTMGAKQLVFGAPRSRQIGSMKPKEARAIAVDFFHGAAAICWARDTVFCIEPNPTTYDCDFINTAREGASLVREVNHPGFGLHLDSAGMHLSRETIPISISESADVLAHFHMSEPFLSTFDDCEVPHDDAGKALREIGYHQCVAIEMRRSEPVADAVERALEIARLSYAN
jgi:D-psicose/D-tagatose/L-ribulose 3-epimerase